MEGKLIKVENGYVLMVNNIMYATDNDKLSLKNCKAIENGYDLNELAREACDITDPLRLDSQKYKQDPYFKIGFNKGFQKALEILGDNRELIIKLNDLLDGLNSFKYQVKASYLHFDCEQIIKSLQKTEWNVIVEMEEKWIAGTSVYGHGEYESIPKLDANGCLILKRK